MAEKLNLHLLKFATAEGVVAGIDLIAECLADLRDAEGQLEARAVEDVAKIGKNPLSCFWATPRRKASS